MVICNWGNQAPKYDSCVKHLIKVYGVECPLLSQQDFAEFAKWLKEDNPMLFIVMLNAYENSIPGVMKKEENDFPK